MTKPTSLCTVLFFLFSAAYGQNYFKLNTQVGDSVPIRINGKQFLMDSVFISVKTHYPAFDTVYLCYPDLECEKAIICNFKPDSSYSLYPACCATTDIVQTSKTKNDSFKIWDYEAESDKFQMALMDQPFITFKIKNSSGKEKIYAWYEDRACFPSFRQIGEKGWRYGVPSKCFYWTNISTFVFFTSKKDYSKDKNKYGIVEDVFPDEGEQELGAITTRLFDGGKYVVTYDCKTKKVSLSYEKSGK